MNLRSPDSLIAALLRNDLSWDEFQTAFKFFTFRERVKILERLDEVVSKGGSGEQAPTAR